MAIIKSGDSSDQLKVDATSKAARITLYNSNGIEIGTLANPLQVIPLESSETVYGEYTASSFRTMGLTTNPHNIFTIENPSGSGRILGIKRMTIQVIQTALQITTIPNFKTSRLASLPTGGTSISAVKFDTNNSAPVAIVRGATASDGGVATVINASPGVTIWQQYSSKLITAAGFTFAPDDSLLPQYIYDKPYILRTGESLLVRLEVNNIATAHYIVQVAWKEYI